MKKIVLAFIIGTMLVIGVLGGCDEILDETPEETLNEISDETIDDVQEEVSTIGQSAQTDERQFLFTTTDIDGNTVSADDFSDAKLIMVNFWEPWCGPCVGEMPDLEKLYEEYSADGFVILGVYSTMDMDDEVREVMSSCGTTYPVLRYEDSMEPYITEYVPTTIFIDSNANVLTDEPIVGGNSYDNWKQMIEMYMDR